jgi:hypothetical protein
LFVDRQAPGPSVGGPGLVINAGGGGGGTFAINTVIADGMPLQLAQWQHVVATYVPDKSMRLWVNGVMVEQLVGAAVPDSIFANNAPLWIGTQFDIVTLGSDNLFFDGLIDEVAVYNFALDDLNADGTIDANNRVTAHFNSAFLAVPEPASIALWTLLGGAVGLVGWRRRHK